MVISCHWSLHLNFSVCFFFVVVVVLFFFVFLIFKITTEQLRLNSNVIQDQDMPLGSRQTEVNPIQSQFAGSFLPVGFLNSSNPTGIQEHPTGMYVGFQLNFLWVHV